VQQLKKRDKEARVAFCTAMSSLLWENPDILNNLLITYEAHFLLSGYINKQNMQYWSPVNPKELHEMPLHSPKVRVWCGVGAFGIVGLCFFENDNEETVTVNSERYVNLSYSGLALTPQPFIFSRMEQQPTLHETVWLLFVKCSELLSLVSATSLGLLGHLTLLYQIFSCGGS
jgi:hypothetical protein